MFVKFLPLLFVGLVHGQQCIHPLTTATPTTRISSTTKSTTTPSTTTTSSHTTSTTTPTTTTTTSTTTTTTTDRCGIGRSCPTSYVAVGQLCYALLESGEHQKLINNAAARQMCKDSGGHLPHFNTSDQYQCYMEWRKMNVHNHWTWLDYYNYAPHSASNIGTWQNSEGWFVPEFQKWAVSQPDNNGNIENCAQEVYDDAAGWHDVSCENDQFSASNMFYAVVCQT